MHFFLEDKFVLCLVRMGGGVRYVLARFWIALCLQSNLCGGSDGSGATKGSFLWQIEGANGPPSYFFGTIHVPYTRVWDAIPNNTKAAFAAASQVG